MLLRVWHSFKRLYSKTAPIEVTNQGHLEEVVKYIFHGKDILRNVKREANILSPTTGSYLELDIWIPELKIAFEFQDPYHYESVWYMNLPVSFVKQTDDVKIQLMEARGETLITVPCWWDNTPESLIATIRLKRKDLFPDASPLAAPIPPEPPPGFFKVPQIPGIGELMVSMFADFQSLLTQENWWMSEKYDGVRACWNPSKKALYARRGNQFFIPKAFLDSFPPCFLDGELWFGRRMFKESQKLIHNSSLSKTSEANLQNAEISWDFLRCVIFDNPASSSRLLPFEERFASLLDSTPASHSFSIVATHVKNLGMRHVTNYTNLIIDSEGEGVMIRKNKSPYEGGKSQFLQKYKAAREDLEALVLEVGESGDYHLQLSSGGNIVAKIASRYTERLPKRGDVVTVSFSAYSSKGTATDPKIERLRDDITWTDDVSTKLSTTTYSKKAFSYGAAPPPTRVPIGYWTDNDGANVREFFENFANSKNFDPLVASNWYRFVKWDYFSYKGSHTLFKHFQGSAIKALLHAFPNIGLRETQFRYVSRSHWLNIDNRKEVFKQIATKYGFDPLVPSHWYRFSTDDIQAEKGASSVLHYYSHSISKALMSLFPTVPFVLSKFKRSTHGYWKSRINRKDFFDNYAMKCGFDPLIASNWYPVSHEDIAAEKGGGTILHLYRSSLMNALLDIYPNVSFDKSEFGVLNRKTYHASNIRKHFDSFARAQGLDPLVRESWYQVTSEMFQEDKICAQILDVRFSGNIKQALCELYPELRLEHHKFTKIFSKPSWRLEGARRRFFTEFAREKGFDPLLPEAWDTITRDDVIAVKGGRKILEYHKGSLHQAIEDLFKIRKEVVYKNI